MGLDNIPRPKPCIVLANAGKLKITYAYENGEKFIKCDETPCPFHNFKHIWGMLGAPCWLRGKAYEDIVDEVTKGEYSLYNRLSRGDLEIILKKLKEAFNIDDPAARIAYAIHSDEKFERAFELATYLETLLSIKEWNGALMAWY